MNISDKNSKHKKIAKIAIIAVFLLMLFLPIFQSVFCVFSVPVVDSENRALAKKPRFNINYLDPYPDSCTQYYNDHFAFRGFFMITNSIIKFLIRESPTKEVVMGKNNFLYYARKEILLYQGNEEFDIQHVADILVQRNKNYKKKGVEFYVVVIPTKYEIYPEYLPAYIKRANETTTDKLCRMMKSHPEVKFLFLKDFLLSKKDKGLLYLINDNHWNHLGAYYAADTILKIIKKDFPIPIYDKSCYQFDTVMSRKGNLSDLIMTNYNRKMIKKDVKYNVSMIDKTKEAVDGKRYGYTPPKAFSYPKLYEIVKNTDTELPKILIIRDSYTTTLMPFLSSSFSKSTYIWDAWKFKENMDIVDNEKPDIVLYIIFEPHIKVMAEDVE